VVVPAPALVAAITVLLLAVIGVLVHLVRRYRREMQALLMRVGDLETALAGTLTGDAETDDAEQPPGAVAVAPPAADVLAGRTSYVRRVVDGSTGEPETMADETIVWIHQRLEDPIGPRQLAEDLCVTLRSLERGLAASLGCTPRQLMTAMKMREARRLLVTGRYRVSEVGARLAFASPSHFSIRFKSFYGTTPSALLKNERRTR